MRLAPAWPFLLAVLLAACVTPEPPPPNMEYVPPGGPPGDTVSAYVHQPREMVWNQLLDRLNQSPLTVEQIERERGVIVATYSGDAEPYVDCGWIVFYGQEKLERLPATREEVNLERVVNGGRFAVRRDLQLDGRLILEVRPEGYNTIVGARSTYVLTKSVDVEDRRGQPRGRTREIVAFATGERGAFAKGTVCQPTGSFELAAMDALPTRRISGLPPADARVAATEIPAIEPLELDVASRPAARVAPAAGGGLPDCTGAERAYCEILEITAPYRLANREHRLGLKVEAIGGDSPLLAGGNLGLDIRLPSYAAYLAVSYVQSDGEVSHVLYGANGRWPANAREFVNDTGHPLAGPGGPHMVLALASDAPLFTSPPPSSEPVESYVANLRQRLAEITAEHPEAQIAASYTFVPSGRNAMQVGAVGTGEG